MKRLILLLTLFTTSCSIWAVAPCGTTDSLGRVLDTQNSEECAIATLNSTGSCLDCNLEGLHASYISHPGPYNFTGANLIGADLTGVDHYGRPLNFSGANFSSANMLSANLRGLNFDGVIFTSANMSGVQAQGAQFENAHMQNASLYAANFSGAHMKSVYLNGAGLGSIDITGANLTHATLTGLWADMRKVDVDGLSIPTILDLRSAKIDANTDFSYANMREADLSGVVWNNLKATNANLSGVDFSNATLTGGVYINSNVPPSAHKSKMGIVNLWNKIKDNVGNELSSNKVEASLAGAKFTNTTISGAHLNGTNFAQAQFSGGATINSGSFGGASFEGATFDELVINGGDFDFTNFTGSVWNKVKFARQIDLSKVDGLSTVLSGWGNCGQNRGVMLGLCRNNGMPKACAEYCKLSRSSYKSTLPSGLKSCNDVTSTSDLYSQVPTYNPTGPKNSDVGMPGNGFRGGPDMYSLGSSVFFGKTAC